MAKSIGIDLGTTNSAVAIKKVHTEVLKNAEGKQITPSCVSLKKSKLPFSKGNFIVGEKARDWLHQDPANTVCAVKRLMGRSFNNPAVQHMLQEKHLSYKLQSHSRGTAKSLSIVLQNKEFTPEEISAEILQRLRDDAQKQVNDDIDYAVVTVPAYFNDKQKHATRTAAALADLKVRRLLPEPTAAAISFGVDNVSDQEAKTVLVFDFGGGTFDLSILTISGGQFIEQGKGGDMWLGGEDIDRLLIDYILEQTASEYEIESMQDLLNAQETRTINRFNAELKSQVEQAKIKLSSSEKAYVEILGLLQDEDKDVLDIDVQLDREKFDQLLAPFIQDMLKLIRNLIQNINFTYELIDNVLLVGGSSQIPLIVQTMQKEFGQDKVLVHSRPMLAIAEGAAILSHRLAEEYECPGCGKIVEQSASTCPACSFDLDKFVVDQGVFDIIHTVAHDYYITLEDGEKQLLVDQNTPLPCSVEETFRLSDTYQQLVHLQFSNMVNEQEENIGDLWLGIDWDQIELSQEQDSDAPLSIKIGLSIDESNLIEATASLVDFPEVSISKTLSRGRADEQLYKRMEEYINQINQEGMQTLKVQEVTYRFLKLIKDINQVLHEDTQALDEGLFSRLDNNIEKTKQLVKNDNLSKSVIAYAEQILRYYDFILSDEDKADIKKCIANLQKADFETDYEKNVQAQNELDKALEELGAVNQLMNIVNASEICYFRGDQNKGQKLMQDHNEIIQAMVNKDKQKVQDLLMNTLQESYPIIQNEYQQTGKIHKGIVK